MTELTKDTLTQKSMEEMCDSVKKGTKLGVISYYAGSFRPNAQADLERLIAKGLINQGSHLQQGIRTLFYDSDQVWISEIPLQYPDNRLIEAVKQGTEPEELLGPMTGIFAHVFQNDVYAVHVRGQGISAPGKIQIVAGMGKYRIYPADNALNEVKEELRTDARLVLPDNRFMDVTPFMKAGRFPQPLFSYIATGDLSHITAVVRNDAELEEFVASMPEEKSDEAYPFLVPMEKLRDFLTEVDSKDKFFGPVKRTAFNFLDWYNQEFDKGY